jgi:hypothetical protein
MKFNKWTMGLAAVGVVSLATAARADEKVSQLNTALSNTTLSGYVDVGAQYVNATGVPGYSTGGSAGADSISLNAVDIALDKPLDATPFSAGYHIELWTGGAGATVTGNLIRQAYLALGTTVAGQEIDWKVGVWDTIIGYEGLTTANNPNYTHSYGFFIEPTTHTGIQGTYKVNDEVTIQAGVADDSVVGGAYTAAINSTVAQPLYYPSILAAVSLTAPDSFGALKGATLTVGGINTVQPGQAYADSLYIGATVPTPIAALKFGGAFDYYEVGGASHVWVGGVYGTWTASDKLSFNLRGEYYDQDGATAFFTTSPHGEEITATVQYALWANVLSRLEARWDHAEYGTPFATTGSGAAEADAFFMGAQLVYTF